MGSVGVRPGHAGVCGRVAARDGRGGLLDSSSPCHQGRSASRAAVRVTHGSRRATTKDENGPRHLCFVFNAIGSYFHRSRRLRMSFLRNITKGLRSLFRKEQVDRELDEELRAYQEMAAEEKMKDGLSRKEALRAVRLERGSLEVSKEIVRSGGWESFVEICWQDLRFGLRMLRKS